MFFNQPSDRPYHKSKVRSNSSGCIMIHRSIPYKPLLPEMKKSLSQSKNGIRNYNVEAMMPLTHFVTFLVDSVREVVAKNDRNIFFWATF